MEEKIKSKDKLSKETINILRTTQRNNIDLTHIADNKANVLLSLNAIMITFLVPLVLSHTDVIFDRFLYIPLIILTATCFATIYIATMVLKPSRLENFQDENDPVARFSPLFFGNFYKMTPEEFFPVMLKTMSNKELVKQHLAQDLYYVGRRLGYKMTWIRRAFNLFLIGLFLSILSTTIVLLLL